MYFWKGLIRKGDYQCYFSKLPYLLPHLSPPTEDGAAYIYEFALLASQGPPVLCPSYNTVHIAFAEQLGSRFSSSIFRSFLEQGGRSP